jgi:hypothetical protein
MVLFQGLGLEISISHVIAMMFAIKPAGRRRQIVIKLSMKIYSLSAIKLSQNLVHLGLTRLVI